MRSSAPDFTLHWTPALLRIRVNMKGHDLAVARERQRYTSTSRPGGWLVLFGQSRVMLKKT
jgi:hypothetical protein